MTARIVEEKGRRLVGVAMAMSLTKNKTGSLWASFMPRRTEIENRVGIHFVSLQVYPSDYHLKFSPATEFIKWALVEVSDFNNIPEGMQTFLLKLGTYAVFDYKGASSDPTVFEYIYGEWLPKSGYVLDNRPHFEVLGANYKNNSPDSEEEIWIPIKRS